MDSELTEEQNAGGLLSAIDASLQKVLATELINQAGNNRITFKPDTIQQVESETFSPTACESILSTVSSDHQNIEIEVHTIAQMMLQYHSTSKIDTYDHEQTAKCALNMAKLLRSEARVSVAAGRLAKAAAHHPFNNHGKKSTPEDKNRQDRMRESHVMLQSAVIPLPDEAQLPAVVAIQTIQSDAQSNIDQSDLKSVMQDEQIELASQSHEIACQYDILQKKLLIAQQEQLHSDSKAVAFMQQRVQVVEAARQAAAERERIERYLLEQEQEKIHLERQLQEQVEQRAKLELAMITAVQNRLLLEQQACESEQMKISAEQLLAQLTLERELAHGLAIAAEQEKIRNEKMTITTLTEIVETAKTAQQIAWQREQVTQRLLKREQHNLARERELLSEQCILLEAVLKIDVKTGNQPLDAKQAILSNPSQKLTPERSSPDHPASWPIVSTTSHKAVQKPVKTSPLPKMAHVQTGDELIENVFQKITGKGIVHENVSLEDAISLNNVQAWQDMNTAEALSMKRDPAATDELSMKSDPATADLAKLQEEQVCVQASIDIKTVVSTKSVALQHPLQQVTPQPTILATNQTSEHQTDESDPNEQLRSLIEHSRIELVSHKSRVDSATHQFQEGRRQIIQRLKVASLLILLVLLMVLLQLTGIQL
jgi:hypothetical protein